MWTRRQALIWTGQMTAGLLASRAAWPAAAAEAPPNVPPEPLTSGIAEIQAKYNLGKVWFRLEREPKDLSIHLERGGALPDEPIPLGGVSNSITAIAIALLLQRGKIKLDSTLKPLLSDYFAQRGQILDSSLEDITISRLLTHTAGLRPNKITDPVHGISSGDILANINGKHHFFDFLIASGEANSNGSEDFAYSNFSYLLLGLVVEAVAQEPYITFCFAEIFNKLGIKSAVVPPGWETMTPFEGWFMSPKDILKAWRVFDLDHLSLLTPQTVNSLLFEKLAEPYSDGEDLFYTVGALERRDPEKMACVLVQNGFGNFKSLQPSFYTFVEKMMPGMRSWVFSTTPGVHDSAQSPIVKDIRVLLKKLEDVPSQPAIPSAPDAWRS